MKSKSIFAKLRGYFLTGVVITAPIGITFYVAILFIGFIDGKVKNFMYWYFQLIFEIRYHLK